MSRAVGLRCTALNESEAAFIVEQAPLVPNPNGAGNGGMLACIADLAMGVVATRCAEPGYLPATVTLHTQFHRPAYAPLTVLAEVTSGGRRTNFVDVVVRDGAGRRCASSQGTMVNGGSGRPGPAADGSVASGR